MPKNLDIVIPDGRLAIDENIGLQYLSQYVAECQQLEMGMPFKSLGYGRMRKASAVQVVEVEAVSKIVEVQNPKKSFIKDKIAIVDLRGVIRSQDGMYSYGTRTKGDQLLAAKKDVIGALFRIDSGGGYMDGAEAMIAAMREFGKPMVALSNLSASAAYMIACECDQVFAETEFSEFGSIGVYITLDKQMRELVNKYLDFAYSEKSPNKNKAYRDYLKDENLEGFVADATHADTMFMKQVRANRRLHGKTEETLSGGMFKALDAKERVLIDDIKNVSEAISIIQKLAA